MNVSIATELQRTAPILKTTPTPTADKRGTLGAAAHALSRRGLAGAKAELANVAIERLLMLLFEVDTDGELCNLDPVGGRILVPVPWGRKGCRHWGLRPSEARILSAILAGRVDVDGKAAWLFAYDAPSRSWCLRLRHYPSLGRAMAALQSSPILAQEWRNTSTALTTAWAAGSGKVANG
jgi:hypothetical protein